MLAGRESRAARVAARGRQIQASPLHKLHADGALWGIVSHLLSWRWSPAQAARTLRTMSPGNPERHVSHKAIDDAIYAHPKGE